MSRRFAKLEDGRRDKISEGIELLSSLLKACDDDDDDAAPSSS